MQILIIRIFATFAFAITTCAQIINPSFEQGLTGWQSSGSAIVVGTSSGNGRWGTDGSNIVNLGSFDVTGSTLYQSISLPGQSNYKFTFSIGSFAFEAGRESRIRVTFSNSAAGLISSNEFSAVSIGGGGTNDFVTNQLYFSTPPAPAGSTNIQITLLFQDVSTNNGAGVDPMLDALSLSSIVPLTTNLVQNFGFEQGLSGWQSLNVAIYGPPLFTQIGTEGTNVAALGAEDAAGSFLQQTITTVSGGSYELSFDTAAMGSAGLRSITRLDVIGPTGENFLSQTFTNFGNGLVPAGSPPFQKKLVVFTTSDNASHVTIRLSDISPNGGVGIDAVVDNFKMFLTQVPLKIRMFPGIILGGTIGRTYAIDYADIIPPMPANWINLTNVTMTVSPTTIIDLSATNNTQRFYRSRELP